MYLRNSHLPYLYDEPRYSKFNACLAYTERRAGACSVGNVNKTLSENVLCDWLSLFDNIPGMAYRRKNKRDWTVLFVSKGSTQLSGYDPKALLAGHPCWGDLIHPDDRVAVWQSVQEAVQGGRRFEVQYRLATRDKRYKWVCERGSALDSDEHGMLIDAFVTDITSIGKKELQLEYTKAFSSAIIESAAEGMVLIDAEFRIDSLNKAATHMFGVVSESAVGNNISDYLSGASYLVLKSDAGRYRESGTSNLFNGGREVTGRRADGSEFPIHLHIRELDLEYEHRYAVLIRDITEQKAKENKIQQQSEMLHATIAHSPVGIYTVDSELRMVTVNLALANMLGYGVKDMIGRRFSFSIHPDDIDAAEEALHSSLAGGPTNYSAHRRYVHRDGHIVHTDINAAVGHDSEGNPEFVVANVEDLTERLGAETQLRDQQEQLARLDRLSTLGEMMAGISHEINQPLTAISTYAQSGLRFMDPKNPKPDRLRVALTKLSEQARRAGAVVERIRELSRQEVSTSQLVGTDCMIRQIEELAVIDARARGARIRFELDTSLPPVWCDPVQIQQVILNLIRNSVDSIESVNFRNGDEIVLRTSVDDEGVTTIAVVDCGSGVSEAVAADLFQPFSTHKRAGLGLGLSISRSIVTAHGGQLDYYNNPSAGATFYLKLPNMLGESNHES